MYTTRTIISQGNSDNLGTVRFFHWRSGSLSTGTVRQPCKAGKRGAVIIDRQVDALTTAWQ